MWIDYSDKSPKAETVKQLIADDNFLSLIINEIPPVRSWADRGADLLSLLSESPDSNPITRLFRWEGQVCEFLHGKMNFRWLSRFILLQGISTTRERSW